MELADHQNVPFFATVHCHNHSFAICDWKSHIFRQQIEVK